MRKILFITLKSNHYRATYIIITLLISVLLISGCATQKVNSAGKINGVYIYKQDFLNSLRGHFTGFVLEKDRTPDDYEKIELYKQTWKDIITHIVLKDYFRKYQIQVTKKEVIDTLVNNIPVSIQKAPVFQTKGKFDKSLYLSALLSEDSKLLDWLKRYYYEYYIPLSKLKLELMNSEVISAGELKQLTKIMNTTADISWIVIDPTRTKVTITQNEFQSYYQANSKDFRIKRYARFGWTAIPVSTVAEDEIAAKTKIDSIYFEITNGKPFAYMAERFSHSTTSESGGSLGFINYDSLSPKIKSAIDGLERNGITHPIKIDNFWVLYQLGEKTRNLVKMNELVI